jgi:hypothetical protein
MCGISNILLRTWAHNYEHGGLLLEQIIITTSNRLVPRLRIKTCKSFYYLWTALIIDPSGLAFSRKPYRRIQHSLASLLVFNIGGNFSLTRTTRSL